MRAHVLALLALSVGATCFPRIGLADTLYLDDHAGFASTAGVLAFESFEDLTATNTEAGDLTSDAIALPAFTISSTSGIGVRDTEIPGADVTATDQLKFIHWDTDVSGDTITFTFDAPIIAFAVTLKDALDAQLGGVNALHLSTSGGASFPSFLTGPLPSGDVHFVGIVATAPFTELTITNGLVGDGVSIDGVYYTPEASTALLLGMGLGGLGIRRRRRMR